MGEHHRLTLPHYTSAMFGLRSGGLNGLISAPGPGPQSTSLASDLRRGPIVQRLFGLPAVHSLLPHICQRPAPNTTTSCPMRGARDATVQHVCWWE